MEGFIVESTGLIHPTILACSHDGSLTDSHIGKFVKLSGNMAVSLCADSEVPWGQIVTLEKGSNVVGVQVAGSMEAMYSGTDPVAGKENFLCDVNGDLKIGVGAVFTVLSVDATNKKISLLKNY
ncbi:MAG: hypothetical protein H7A25_22235 [Leptospiraceae bacterium]|nr:hypothetical protein [Leptospiraceae bacterium]MCP5502633.1 hypothetical protein [Leptospiraceae bacterium]